MATREFHFSDGKSDKFWKITLESSSHTVNYGREGTTGQTQTRQFDNAEDAKQSYEKLIAEKLKKGYTEAGAANPGSSITSPGSPSPKKKPAPAKSAAAARADSGTDTPSTEDDLTSGTGGDSSAEESIQLTSITPGIRKMPRSIDLDPVDWFMATWRPFVPLQKPEPQPFNKKEALARLGRVTGSYSTWDWSKARITHSLSRGEAHFWLTAMTEASQAEKPKALAEKLKSQEFTGDFGGATAAEVMEKFNPRGDHLLPLSNLFSAEEIIEGLMEHSQRSPNHSYRMNWLVGGFADYILPYLTEEERKSLQAKVRSRLDLSTWPTTTGPPGYPVYSNPPGVEFYLAAYLGLHREMLALVETWKDDQFADGYGGYYHQPHEIVFGLGSAELVQQHFHRLKLRLVRVGGSDRYMRYWLAHTEYSGLDLIKDTILSVQNKEEAECYLRTFSLVKAPEAAPVMIDLMLASRAPGLARQWLLENPAFAIPGALPVAAGRGRQAEAAIDLLQSWQRKGYGEFIQQCLEEQPAEGAARIRKALLDAEEPSQTPFEETNTPSWLQEVLSAGIKVGRTLSWVEASDFPPVVCGEHRLNTSQVEALLSALQSSKLDSPHPLVAAVRSHADRKSLDAFSWRLFERWLGAGAPSRENWAMAALGLLGNDATALRLTPMIRAWPGESQHSRAVFGLDCLRAIGTDTALMQINGIAQKVPFKALKERAAKCMEGIAADRNLSRAELEDRIVPDCELDERGSRTFDFGSRQFQFVLGPEMKPMVRDAEGKLKSDLPKPGARDNGEKANEATAQWKLLKKQVAEVVKIQSIRLEQAMVTGRRWPLEEFEMLLVHHPLMTNLARLLVWGSYDAAGKLTGTFRITEDQEYATMSDEPFTPEGMPVIGIVHPLLLSEEQRASWGELLSDYEIVPPFPQLGRPIAVLTEQERGERDIQRYKGVKIPAVSLVGALEKLGWTRGVPEDAGIFSEHSKPFYGSNVTAIVRYQGVPVGYMVDWEDQEIEHCFFVPGIYRSTYYPRHENALSLGDVDPIAISEVLSDLSTVASKGK